MEWFNKVDETYKAELRELNESNWERFDARLEQRLAELGSAIRGELASFDVSLRGEVAAQGERLGERMASLEIRMGEAMVAQTRWMVGLWAAQVMAFIGTILIVLRAA